MSACIQWKKWIFYYLYFNLFFFAAKSGDSKSKRSDSVAKTDDDTTDKVWEDTDKDCDQLEQSNLENNNEDEDEASVERLVSEFKIRTTFYLNENKAGLIELQLFFLFRSYDRFKNSEKTDEADVSETDADKELDSSKNETVEQNGTESTI